MGRPVISRVRYGSNGPPPRRCQFGPKCRDEVTGFTTYEDLRVIDDYGYKVDPRICGVDIDETKDVNIRGVE